MTVTSGSTIVTSRSRRRDLQCFFALVLSPEVETRCSMATIAREVLQLSQILLETGDWLQNCVRFLLFSCDRQHKQVSLTFISKTCLSQSPQRSSVAVRERKKCCLYDELLFQLLATISYVVNAAKNKNKSCSIVTVFCVLAFVAKCEVIVVTRWQDWVWKGWTEMSGLWSSEPSSGFEVLYLKKAACVQLSCFGKFNWASFFT